MAVGRTLAGADACEPMGGRTAVEAAATTGLPGTGEGEEALDAGIGTEDIGGERVTAPVAHTQVLVHPNHHGRQGSGCAVFRAYSESTHSRCSSDARTWPRNAAA